MNDDQLLAMLIDKCKVKEIDHGHKATMFGVPGTFRASWGPNEWTKEMACKSAIFFWALRMRDDDIVSASI